MLNIPSFLVYVIITAYTPGPNNIMSMTNAGTYGLRNSFPFNLGMWFGFSVVMLICTFFSAALFTLIPQTKNLLKLLGASYMLFLAWKTCKGSTDSKKNTTEAPRFISGAMLQFVNPKIIIYGITAMSSFILPYTTNPGTLFFFALFLAFVGFTGSVCWATAGYVCTKMFSAQTKAINTVLSALLVFCAVSLFL